MLGEVGPLAQPLYRAVLVVFQASAVLLAPVLWLVQAPFGKFAVPSRFNLNGALRAGGRR